jgi:hypothetical protein
MTKTTKAPAGEKKPDGTLTKQTENHTYVIQVFFNHDSKETFQDKLLKIILAEELTAPITPETEPPKLT